MVRKGLLLLALAVLLLTGCKEISPSDIEQTEPTCLMQSTQTQPTEPTAPNESYAEAYRDLLDEFFAVVSGKEDSTAEGTLGVWEAIMSLDTAKARESVGYGILDVSGDGIPELVIGSVSSPSEMANGTMLYAIYTVADGKAECVLEGRARSSFRPMKDGGFFYQGSSGAMYSLFGVYDPAENSRSLLCRDFYFTFEKNKEKTEIGFYHNKTGEWDVGVSEELSVSADAFWAMEADLLKDVCLWDLTPFSSYSAAENSSACGNDQSSPLLR